MGGWRPRCAGSACACCARRAGPGRPTTASGPPRRGAGDRRRRPRCGAGPCALARLRHPAASAAGRCCCCSWRIPPPAYAEIGDTLGMPIGSIGPTRARAASSSSPYGGGSGRYHGPARALWKELRPPSTPDPTRTTRTTPDDAAMLADLARVLDLADPVPAETTLAARSAFAHRALDAEIAALSTPTPWSWRDARSRRGHTVHVPRRLRRRGPRGRAGRRHARRPGPGRPRRPGSR